MLTTIINTIINRVNIGINISSIIINTTGVIDIINIAVNISDSSLSLPPLPDQATYPTASAITYYTNINI